MRDAKDLFPDNTERNNNTNKVISKKHTEYLKKNIELALKSYNLQCQELFRILLLELQASFPVSPKTEFNKQLSLILQQGHLSVDSLEVLIAAHRSLLDSNKIDDFDKSWLRIKTHFDLLKKIQSSAATKYNTTNELINDINPYYDRFEVENSDPRSLNLLNEVCMDANGWLAAKTYKQQLNELTEQNKDANTNIYNREVYSEWHLTQKKYYQAMIKASQQFALSDKDAYENKTFFENLTEVKVLESDKAFSADWVMKHAYDIPAIYLSPQLQLTDQAIAHLEGLLEKAYDANPNDMSEPEVLSRQDMVLLSLYLGRDTMFSLCQKYALYGNGTPEYPFNMDNLRAVLVGMANNRSEGNEVPHIKNLLDIVKNRSSDEKIRLGWSPRMLLDFNNRSQNQLSEAEVKILGSSVRWSREVSYPVVQSSNERYAAPAIIGLDPVTYVGMSYAFTALTHARLNNDPGAAYLNDLKNLTLNGHIPDKNRYEITTGDKALEKILEKLERSPSYKDFCFLYPMFRTENDHKNSLVEEYFNTQPRVLKQELKTLIKNRVDSVDLLARSERISHGLAYININQRKDFEHTMLDRSLKERKFLSKNIISPETGLGVNLYSPAKSEKLADSNTIPLMIILPGTQNQPGILRDTNTISPGKAQWMDPEIKKKILVALNSEIKELRQRYPGKQINLEVMGHSLGGSDALQMELLILEAMGQNLMKKPEGRLKIKQYYQSVVNIIDSSESEELKQLEKQDKKSPSFNLEKYNKLKQKLETKEALLEGLKTAGLAYWDVHGEELIFGSKPRRYNTIFDKPDDRRIPEEQREFISQDTIAELSCFCNRGAGAGEEDTKAECALMGLLSDSTQINQDCFRVTGDPLQYIGAAKYFGAVYADKSLDIFKNKKLNCNFIELDTKTGLNKSGWFTKSFARNKTAPKESHIGYYSAEGDQYGADLKFINNSEAEFAAYNKALTGQWLKADSLPMRAFKWSTKMTLLALRALTEIPIRYIVLNKIPRGFRYASKEWDASHKGATKEAKEQREQYNQAKKKIRDDVYLSTTTDSQSEYDKGILKKFSIADDFRFKNITINKRNTGTFLDDPQLVDHLKLQLHKAKEYKIQWDNIDGFPVNEMKEHDKLIQYLENCFSNDKINHANCVAFIKEYHKPSPNIDEHIKNNNPKTLSLETKALMPIAIAIQRQKYVELMESKNTQPRAVYNKKLQAIEENIDIYAEFLIQEDLLSKKVMSTKWLVNATEDLHSNKNDIRSGFINFDPQKQRFTLNEHGLDHLEVLFKKALTQPLNNDPLTTADLALLGHYFGRKCMKKVMDRYSLSGDGSALHPFSMDNLRILMIGAAAFPNTDYTNSSPHKQHIENTNKRTLNAVTNPAEQVKLFRRIIDNLNNFEQNELAQDSQTDSYRLGRAFGRGIARAYKFIFHWGTQTWAQAGSADMTTALLGGNFDPLYQNLEGSGVAALLNLLEPDNPAATNLANDVKQLYYEKLSQNIQPETPAPLETTINGIMAELERLKKSNKTNAAEIFYSRYPVFEKLDKENIDNYLRPQNSVPVVVTNTNRDINSAESNSPPPSPHLAANIIHNNYIPPAPEPEVIRACIKNRLNQINDWKRASDMANLSYKHIYSKNATQQVIDSHGNILSCNATTVLETGIPLVTMNCFWPTSLPNKEPYIDKANKQTNEPVTLMIQLPEDIDTINIQDYLASHTRAAALYRAGRQSLTEYSISQADRAADDERKKECDQPKQTFNKSGLPMDNAERRNEAKRKLLESIDKQIELILKQYPNRKINLELFGHGVAASHIHHIELYIMQALQKRNLYESTYLKTTYQPKNISLDNIAGIKSYAFDCPGEASKTAKERADLALELQDKINIEHNSFYMEGDPGPYMGADHADRHLANDPKSKVKINHVTSLSDQGMKNKNWLVNRVLKGHVDRGQELSNAQNRFGGPGAYHANMDIATQGTLKLQQNLGEQTGHILPNKFKDLPRTNWMESIRHQCKNLGYFLKYQAGDYARYQARGAAKLSVMYPTNKGHQGALKWTSHILLKPINNFRQWVYQGLFATKADAKADREKDRTQHIEQVVGSSKVDEFDNQRKRLLQQSFKEQVKAKDSELENGHGFEQK